MYALVCYSPIDIKSLSLPSLSCSIIPTPLHRQDMHAHLYGSVHAQNYTDTEESKEERDDEGVPNDETEGVCITSQIDKQNHTERVG